MNTDKFDLVAMSGNRIVEYVKKSQSYGLLVNHRKLVQNQYKMYKLKIIPCR